MRARKCKAGALDHRRILLVLIPRGESLLTARVRCCRFAKQTREFREMEDEAFPTFAAGPPPGAMGRQSGMASRGEAEDAEEGSSVSTSACSSTTAAAAPEHPRLPAAGDVSPAAPKAQDSPASPRAANAPFHRVSMLQARP